MKILEVVDLGYVAGGAEKSVKLISDSLRARGNEVLVLATDKNSTGKEVFADEFVPSITGPSFVRLFRFFWNPPTYRRVRRLIRDFRPDIVHLHTISEFSPSLLWGLGKTPFVLTVHGPEEFTGKLLPWLLPSSDYRNSSYLWKDIRFVGRLRYMYYRFLQRPAYRLALRRLRLVISPSKFMAQVVQADFPRTPATQIYNGIVLPPAKPLPRSPYPTIIYVGRLEAVKGVDHLVKAFAAVQRKFPRSRLRIVGDGTQSAALKQLAEQLKVSDSIDFPGWVEQQRIAQEYAAATLAVIPSVWPENLPTVAIEALAVGRPIVGSRTGGVSELIDDGINGFIVEPGNDAALAEAIISLLSDTPLLRSAAKASASKAQAFSNDAFVDRLLDVYKGILDENSNR
jgi:glycosyltransferase involved in cell wall biosynthesis